MKYHKEQGGKKEGGFHALGGRIIQWMWNVSLQDENSWLRKINTMLYILLSKENFQI